MREGEAGGATSEGNVLSGVLSSQKDPTSASSCDKDGNKADKTQNDATACSTPPKDTDKSVMDVVTLKITQ